MSPTPLPWRRVASVMGVAALVSALCVLLGLWQWSRHAERSAAVALVEANLGTPAVPVTEVVGPDGTLPDRAVWREVEVEGRYVGEPVLLRNRPIGGGPGYHVLGVVRVEDGPLADRLLVVDRGFLPGALDAGTRLDVPDPPSGPVDLTVRLRADEPASARSAPEGQVQAVHSTQVVAAAAPDGPADDGAVLPWYGVVRTEAGERPVGLAPLPSPSTDLGSNLSYAFQWWVFSLGALVGAVILLRREAAGTVDPGVDTAPASPRTRRRPTAEEEEDALLDAQVERGR